MNKDEADRIIAESLGQRRKDGHSSVEKTPLDSPDTTREAKALVTTGGQSLTVADFDSSGTSGTRSSFPLSLQALVHSLRAARAKSAIQLKALKMDETTFLARYQANNERMKLKYLEWIDLLVDADRNEIRGEKTNNRFRALAKATSDLDEQTKEILEMTVADNLKAKLLKACGELFDKRFKEIFEGVDLKTAKGQL